MMKLAYASLSPFVRKVTALAIECGLEDRIERVAADPWSDSDPLPKVNPLGKVPALQLEDGTLLTGSSLICQYDVLPEKNAKFDPESRARSTLSRICHVQYSSCPWDMKIFALRIRAGDVWVSILVA